MTEILLWMLLLLFPSIAIQQFDIMTIATRKFLYYVLQTIKVLIIAMVGSDSHSSGDNLSRIRIWHILLKDHLPPKYVFNTFHSVEGKDGC